MSYTVTQSDVFSVEADAAVLGVENPMVPSRGFAFQQLAEAGGDPLRQELRRLRFLSVGRAASVDPCGLPFRHLLLTASPRWQNGEANDLPVLRICYQSLYDLAEKLDVRRIVMPFLSAGYYRFPQREAIQIAFTEAAARDIETVFLAETRDRYDLCLQAVRKPRVFSYIGYYRDHAVFELENGMFAFVDLRPEVESVTLRAFYDSCYLAETDPARRPLSNAEVSRLRRIYENFNW